MKGIKINKKLLIMPLSVFILSACGTESENEERGGASGGSQTISQAKVSLPELFLEGSPVLDKENNSITLRFSLNENKKDNFYIYDENRNNDIREIIFELDYKEDLNNYIEGYEILKDQVSNLGYRLLNEREAQIQISIDDLPANLYQNSEEMDGDRVIEDILNLKMTVNNGTQKIKNINLDYKNENSLPRVPRFFDTSFEFEQNSANYISVPINDSNKNDNLTYSITVSGQPNFISFETEQSCESKESYELINCVIPKGDNREALIRINTNSVSSEYELENFTFTFTDQSAVLDGQSPNEVDFEDNFNVDLGELNTISTEFEIQVLNSDADLSPSVIFSNNTYEISESDGGYISYEVVPATDRPNEEITVDYEINLNDMIVNINNDLENNKIEFSGISISENKERVLSVTASDGVYSSTSQVLVRFLDNIDKSPTLNVPAYVSIRESEGGSINYSANSNDPDRELSVTGHLSLNGEVIEFSHDNENNRFVFEDLAIQQNAVGIFTVTASSGAESISQEIAVEFESDINPIIVFPEIIEVMEDENNLNIFTYNIDIENNTQGRNLDYSFQITTPDGVVIEDNVEDSSIRFNTTNFYTRQDIIREMRITASDGVSTVEQDVTVNFINDIDKEMRDFLLNYDPLINNVNELLSIDAEYKILDFYAEVSRISGVPSKIVNESVEYGREILEFERNVIENLIMEINNDISEINIDDLNPNFDNLYQSKEILKDEVKGYGMFVVSDIINVLSEESSLPSLNPTENQMGLTGVYGRYIGFGEYGTIITGNRFETRSGYKFLDLVNPSKNLCN